MKIGSPSLSSLVSDYHHDFNIQNNQKLIFNRRISFEKSLSRLQKSTHVNPDRNQQFRYASFSTKFSSKPIEKITSIYKPHSLFYIKKKSTTHNYEELASASTETPKSACGSAAVDNHDQITHASNEVEANKQLEAAATECNDDVHDKIDGIEDISEEEEKPEGDQNQDNNQSKEIVESSETKPEEQNNIESEAKLVDQVKEEDCIEDYKKELEESKEKNDEVKNLDEDKDKDIVSSSKELEEEKREEKVVKETASKLLVERMNRVKALVGAFESVIDFELAK